MLCAILNRFLIMSKRYTSYLFLAVLFFCCSAGTRQGNDPRFLVYVTSPSDLTFFWKDDTGSIIGSIQNLKAFTERKNKELAFAMNGGMYNKDHSPQGLYIENGLVLASLDTLS